jgi:hypothetical protein
LIGNVGDDRRADANSNACQKQDWCAERLQRFDDSDRHHNHQRDGHGGAQALDATAGPSL